MEEAKVDLIMLACSTFNNAAELARPLVNTPIAQIDRPMMEMAVQKTGITIAVEHLNQQESNIVNTIDEALQL